jgi:hypothetical protein
MLRKTVISLSLTVAALALVGCTQLGPQVTPAPPTKTPKPTFTATPDWTPTQEVFPTFTPAEPAATATAEPAQAEPTAEATSAEAAPTAAPAAEESTEVRLTANQTANVRSGPGTSYPAIGRLSAGDSYPIVAKNPGGDWYQFEIEGREGWVTASLVSVSGDAGTVEVAQNIAPPPTPRPRPTAAPRPTAVPQPPAAPQPTAAPARRYEFNVAAVQACRRQPAGNWFSGTVYKGGQPFNGARVVFSYGADGPWATPPQVSGPHEGYTNWNAGYYSHIINAASPKAGTWYVWIVDAGGARISEIANWSATGPGDGCNEAVVDFDSR